MTQPLYTYHRSPRPRDARQRRSREALFTAFLQLLEHKSLDQIAIREIAATAGIGHATFYRHYPDKETLLNDIAADEIRRLVDLTLPVMNAENSRAACLALCQYVQAHRTLWTTLLTGGAAGTLKEELIAISRRIAETAGHGSGDAALTELIITLTVSAMVETLTWWLRQSDPPSSQSVAALLDRSLSYYADWTTDLADDNVSGAS